MKKIPSSCGEANGQIALDSLVTLINFRDAEMCELVLNLISKTGTVPAKFISNLPTISQDGPFTYNEKVATEGDTKLTPLQGRILTTVREMRSLDAGLRSMKFGQNVSVEYSGGSRCLAGEELRVEITKWFNKC